MRFAVDLLWVRPNKVGGTEFYIRNILKGFMQLEEDFEAVLILTKDNAATFDAYFTDSRFKKIVCDIDSANIYKRLLWQNLNLGKLLKRQGISICFEPVYSKPFFTSKKIKFITTIHDLQAWHYPEYQSKFKVKWLKFSWKNSVRTSNKIIAISEFVREDIIDRYKVYPAKVLTIHNAVDIDKSEMVTFDEISKKFNIVEDKFYYTVASLAPHKNLITLIKVIKAIKDRKIDLPAKLLISGIGGRAEGELLSLIHKNELEDNIVLTGFVENAERNTLYSYCRAFLFSSVFEGFGMPPVEAMAFGANVITTKKASLFEVTQGKANYVDNPYDIEEWIRVMRNINVALESIDLNKYDAKYIAQKYLKCLSSVHNTHDFTGKFARMAGK